MKTGDTDRHLRGHGIPVEIRAVATLALAAMVALAGRPASAAEIEAIHLRYAAPDECPAEGALVAVAEELGGSFRAAAPGDLARNLEVLIRKSGRGYAGSLSVRSLQGDERTRTVTCARCDAVVRALGFFVALALTSEPPPPDAASPTPPRPVDTEPARRDELEDDPGGLSARILWGKFDWTPTGASVVAVARGPTHFGATATITSESVSDVTSRNATTSQFTNPSGQGQSVRLGAVAAWGAPWSRDEWAGLTLEAGLQGGFVQGSTFQATTSTAYCSNQGSALLGSCTSGPPVATTWRFASPYLSGTFVMQILRTLPVHPFLGITAAWRGNFRGDSAANLTLDLGLAWRSW